MKISKELLKGSTVIMLLSALGRGEKYGYEITKEIERRSEGLFALNEGTIYPLLHTLENEGMIAGRWVEAEGSRKRKYYALTDKGVEMLKTKQSEWTLFCRGMAQVLGSQPAGGRL